jgi:hypothetical protein
MAGESAVAMHRKLSSMTTIYGNTDAEGNAKAITAGCYKYGGATLLLWGGRYNDFCYRDL